MFRYKNSFYCWSFSKMCFWWYDLKNMFGSQGISTNKEIRWILRYF